MFPDTVIAGAVLNGDANVHRPSTPCVVGCGDVAAVLILIAEKVDWKFAVYGNTPVGAVSSIRRCAATGNFGCNRSLIHSAKMPVRGRADKPSKH
jgi:hypothetical protein